MKSDLAAVINDAGQREVSVWIGRMTAFGPGWTAEVDFGSGPVSMPRLRSYGSPGVGDVCLVLRNGDFFYCLGSISPTGAPPPPPSGGTSKPPTQTSGTTTFTAIDAATFRNGRWRTDTRALYQGDYTGSGLNQAYWFYGPAIHNTLEGATVTSASIWLRRAPGGVYAAQTPTLWHHGSATRPANSAPARDSSFPGPALAVGQGTAYSVPVSLAQALVDGDGGISMYVGSTSPYVAIYGLDNDTRSGALTISWRR